MTLEEKNSLKIGDIFESPNGYQYEVLNLKSSPDGREINSYIHMKRLDDKSERTHHYSKQPFYRKLSHPTTTKQEGNPYGTSRHIF